MAPALSANDVKQGQQVRFYLLPAPSDTGQMEPVKVSVFAKGGTHIVSVARNKHGDLVANTEAEPAETSAKNQQPARATLYTSFYEAALKQNIPADTILKLLRVHSYDVDFKQKVRSGDMFEVFFDDDSTDRDTARCSTPR